MPEASLRSQRARAIASEAEGSGKRQRPRAQRGNEHDDPSIRGTPALTVVEVVVRAGSRRVFRGLRAPSMVTTGWLQSPRTRCPRVHSVVPGGGFVLGAGWYSSVSNVPMRGVVGLPARGVASGSPTPGQRSSTLGGAVGIVVTGWLHVMVIALGGSRCPPWVACDVPPISGSRSMMAGSRFARSPSGVRRLEPTDAVRPHGRFAPFNPHGRLQSQTLDDGRRR